MLDQAFSSIGNGLILFALAVVTSIDEFGRIAPLFTLVAAAIGILRGALGTPLLLEAGKSDSEIKTSGSRAVTAALCLSVPLSIALILLGLGSGLVGETFLLAVAAPIVLMQDICRYVAITLGHPEFATVWDGIWCLGSLVFLVLAWGHPAWLTPSWLVAAWAMLATVALIGLLVGLRIRPSIRGLIPWLLNGGGHRVRYAVDAGLEQVTVFVVLLLVAIFLSNDASAAMRGATALLAPLAIVASALPLLIIPESARAQRSPRATWRALSVVAAATSVVALSMGVAFYFLPEAWGRLLLGASYEASRTIVLLIAFQYSAVAWNTVISVYLKSQNRSAEALAVKCCSVATTLLTVSVAVGYSDDVVVVAAAFLLSPILSGAAALGWFKPWREPRSAGRHRRLPTIPTARAMVDARDRT
ncbi:hypothetical protein ACWDTD_19935 [Gordonia sp. NPDC003425]